MTTEYLFAVQNSDGREVASWRGTAKVADVTAVRDGNTVTIEHAGDVVARGHAPADADLALLRWHADDKLADPVRRNVTR